MSAANRIFNLLMPSDVDQVLDMYIEAGVSEGDPYWTRAWPSSIALASLILSRPELVRGKKVADLGCGLGLAGMAAAFAGARGTDDTFQLLESPY
jgi:predicted nicotinamide N-methyase